MVGLRIVAVSTRVRLSSIPVRFLRATAHVIGFPGRILVMDEVDDADLVVERRGSQPT